MSNGGNNLADLAKRAGMSLPPNVAALANSGLLRPAMLQKITTILRRQEALRNPNPHAFLPAPTPQEAAAGTIPLGRVVSGKGPEYLFNLRRDEGSTGFLIAAPTGGGKSVLLSRIALAYHQQNIPVWLFDTEGDLAAYMVGATPDILVVDYHDFRQELFEPDPRMNLTWLEYISHVTGSWTGPICSGAGMTNMSREIAITVHERSGYVSVYDFINELEGRKYRLSPREGAYHESLRNRFGGEIGPLLGRTYSGGHHDLLRMLQRSIVWRLRGLSVDVLSFFTTELLLAVSLLQAVRPGGVLTNLQILDEFSRFVGSRFQPRGGGDEPFIIAYSRTCRKRGCGLLISTQTPQMLPMQILSDMNTLITGKPIDGNYLDCIASALNLNREQESALMELPDRGARRVVVRTPGISYPFMLELPQEQLAWATPEQIEQRVQQAKQWLNTIYQPPTRTAPPAAAAGAAPLPLFVRDHQLPIATQNYLVSCAREWFMPVTERDKARQISGSVGHKHRQRLKAEGLVTFHEIQTGRPGGRLQLTEVTDLGYRLLDELQVHVPRPHGRGGFEHRFWQHTIHASMVARGYPAQVEYERAGKAVDVGVTWEETNVAIEIVCEGLEKELSNLAKDREAGWERVIFCAVTQETLDQLKNLVVEKFGDQLIREDKVRFERCHRFLDRGAEKA